MKDLKIILNHESMMFYGVEDGKIVTEEYDTLTYLKKNHPDFKGIKIAHIVKEDLFQE